MEDWVTIRTLKSKNPLMSNREIGRLLGGISHNTVNQALKRETAPVYKREPVANPSIVPFKEYIEECRDKDYQGSRILEEIQSKGYTGSKSAFYRHLSKLEKSRIRTFKPYETEFGEQAQFDWSPYTVLINGEMTVVYVHSYILGKSRYRIYECSLSQSLASVFEALENSMIEIGGVCSRVQTDNAKCFINNASHNKMEWNPRYLSFCGHYRFQPSRSLPKHPWSKGKVERPFHFLEEHFIKGNEFHSYEEFRERLKSFQEKVNSRVHHTTKQIPKDMYLEELNSLSPLPANRFVDIKEEVRKVSADCLVSFQGSRYSVPHFFATKEVWLKVSQGYRLLIYSSQNKLIAEHILSLKKGALLMKDEHYKEHAVERGNWERMANSFLTMFPDSNCFLDKLKTQKRINPRYHLTQVIELAKYYKHSDLEKAFNKCFKYNTFNYLFIKGFLQNHGQAEVIPPTPISSNILENIENVDIKRNLDEYKFQNIYQ